VLSVGSFSSYVKDARSHELEIYLSIIYIKITIKIRKWFIINRK